ncbi:MAG: PilT protein domain-containing protein [Parcubacteria group bacterium Greene0416_79]|nr:MAG: PilT protein domain-containing protein [Parcubacteria group bacterium Greene0416_79]
MYCCVDTHTLIWYLTSDRRLSLHAESFLSRAEAGELTMVISPIVLLECMDIFEKGKARFDFQALMLRIANARNLVIASVDWNLILEVERTKGFKDLHDRVVVATARLFDAPLLSRDRIIRRLYTKTVW